MPRADFPCQGQQNVGNRQIADAIGAVGEEAPIANDTRHESVDRSSCQRVTDHESCCSTTHHGRIEHADSAADRSWRQRAEEYPSLAD
jgi:hypothetical protein